MENEKVFIDTSAFYALMDRCDKNHDKAAGLWPSLLIKDQYIATSSYVIVETLALLQNRLGFEAANLWYQDILGLAEILWVEESIHNLAYELWLSLGRRKLSFVDCIGFVTMRHFSIKKVFGFDRHFIEQGFEVLG
jgi:uncharacterized protein